MSSFSLDSVIYFGKFKGKTVKQIADTGPDGRGYLQWMRGKFEFTNEVGVYMKTGKVVAVKTGLEPDPEDYWGKLIINGIESDIPF